jgi:hypothetical protein
MRWEENAHRRWYCGLAGIAGTKKAARFLTEENLAELGECSCPAETCILNDHRAGKQMVFASVRS